MGHIGDRVGTAMQPLTDTLPFGGSSTDSAPASAETTPSADEPSRERDANREAEREAA